MKPTLAALVLFPLLAAPAAAADLDLRLHGGAASTSMQNGRVLIAGGLTLLPIINFPVVSNTAYAYNPALDSFGLPAFFTGPRLLHSAVALPDGKVLLAGGLGVDFSQVIATGDLTQLVVSTQGDGQAFTASLFGGSFATVSGLAPRAGAGLADGGALAPGGFELTLDAGNVSLVVLTSADRYLPGGGFVPTGVPVAGGVLPHVVPLADGTVLVAGGGAAAAEVFQP